MKAVFFIFLKIKIILIFNKYEYPEHIPNNAHLYKSGLE